MGQSPIAGQSVKMPTCRFCQAAAEHQSIKGDFVYGGTPDQHFYQCAKCQIIYLYPAMSEADEARFYNKEFEKYMSGRAGKDMDWTGPEAHVKSNAREIKRRMPFLKKYIKKGKSVLEVGCSSGFMLSALKKTGAQVCGLDLSGGFIDFVRSQKIEVHQSLNDLRATGDRKFDFIIHYYVFEHIRHPQEFIKEHMALLKKGGKMIFEVPCATDPLVELYKIPAFDRFYWSVAHHWYFNKESLGRVLKKTGYRFELFPDQRYDISNHMTWMQDGKPGGYGRYSSVFGEKLDGLYKEVLKKNWICDTIIAVLTR